MRRKPAKNRLPQISTRPVKTQTCTSPPFSLSRHVCVPGKIFSCQDTNVYFAAFFLCQDIFVYVGAFPLAVPVKTHLCTFCTAPLCQATFAACIKAKQKVPLPHSHAIRAPCLVRKMGLEPTRHGHTHLKRACLPIPALPQITGRTSVANGILAQMPAKCKGFCKKSFVEQVVGKDSAKKPPYSPKKQQRNGCNPAPFCYNGRWISHAAGGRIFPPGQEEYKTL